MPKRKLPPSPEPDEDRPRLTIGQLRELGRLTQPQFPDTPEGQLARVFKQEALNNLREQRLNEAADRIAYEAEKLQVLLDRATNADGVAAAAAAAATRAVVEALPKVLHQLSMFVGGEEPNEHCPGYPLLSDDWTQFRLLLVAKQGDDDDVSKRVIAGRLGVVVRTISRAMEWHGLKVRQWPPSTWPLEAPLRPKKTNHAVTVMDPHTVLLTAGLFGYAFLDVVVDGKLDHIVRLLHACGVRLVQT